MVIADAGRRLWREVYGCVSLSIGSAEGVSITSRVARCDILAVLVVMSVLLVRVVLIAVLESFYQEKRY